MKKIVVFFGGKSVESEISIITGVMTANAISREKYEVIPILVGQTGEWFTGKSLLDIDDYKNLDYRKLDRVTFVCGQNVLYKVKNKKLKPISPIYVAVNCMHGGWGEEGGLVGLISGCNIPTLSPPMLASAISLDKSFTKTVLKGLGVSALPCVTVQSAVKVSQVKDKLNYPVIVKPNLLGSSIGITKVLDSSALESAVNSALRYGAKAIIEPCLTDFTEINCAVYRASNGEIVLSPCEQPVGKDNVLSFDDKYKCGKRIFPAKISKKLSDKIQRTTKKVYEGCNFSGIIRIDYLVKGDNVYLNEINAVPGSLAYYLFCKTLKDFSVLLDDLITCAVKEYAQKSTFTCNFKSGILCSSGAKGVKKSSAKS